MGLVILLAGVVTESTVIVIEVVCWSLEKFHTFTTVVGRILVVTKIYKHWIVAIYCHISLYSKSFAKQLWDAHMYYEGSLE